MSKALVVASILLALPLILRGQNSSVNFANGSSVGLPLVLAPDGVGLHSANYVAQLFESTDGGASFSAVGTTSSFFTVTPTSVRAGVWKAQAITLAGVNPGSVVTMKVAVWDSTLFASWDAADAEVRAFTPIPGKLAFGDTFQLGITPNFSYQTPATGDLNPADFNLVAFPGLTLSSYIAGFTGTPEPSTMALTVVGGAGLALFCQRKFKANLGPRKMP